ncbi:hypothetical protein EYF80_053752 [Liparis tanakae]|uniref:Uncharacterized protein n=1 Tax=Liparis tanakae TaxID=230148 RepID=A0A4Z2F4Q9_9TELE|nr:hypothetical protein EYF80_053752 [Liparis tanakae]
MEELLAEGALLLPDNGHAASSDSGRDSAGLDHCGTEQDTRIQEKEMDCTALSVLSFSLFVLTLLDYGGWGTFIV